MKLYFLILSVIALHFSAAAQKVQNQDLQGEWVIEKGWFGKDTILLKKPDADKDTSVAQMLIFGQKDSLAHNYYVPVKLRLCGVGLVHLDTASWRLNVNKITFYVKGGYGKGKRFNYKMIYAALIIDRETIILKKVKTLLSEEKKYSGFNN